jgi:hypothetical protein
MLVSDLTKATAYASLAVFLLTASYYLREISHQTTHLLSMAEAPIAELQRTLETVNRPCPAGSQVSPCGTLADINKALNTIRGTAGQIEVAARHENKNLTMLDEQERTLFADLHSTLQQAQATTAELQGTAQATTATLGTLNSTIQSAQAPIGHLDAFITAPDLQAMVKNANRATGNGADLLEHLASTSQTFDQVTKKAAASYLHPPPMHWYGYIPPTLNIAWHIAMLAK